jgi:hypothetical protein
MTDVKLLSRLLRMKGFRAVWYVMTDTLMRIGHSHFLTVWNVKDVFGNFRYSRKHKSPPHPPRTFPLSEKARILGIWMTRLSTQTFSPECTVVDQTFRYIKVCKRGRYAIW